MRSKTKKNKEQRIKAVKKDWILRRRNGFEEQNEAYPPTPNLPRSGTARKTVEFVTVGA